MEPQGASHQIIYNLNPETNQRSAHLHNPSIWNFIAHGEPFNPYSRLQETFRQRKPDLRHPMRQISGVRLTLPERQKVWPNFLFNRFPFRPLAERTAFIDSMEEPEDYEEEVGNRIAYRRCIEYDDMPEITLPQVQSTSAVVLYWYAVIEKFANWEPRAAVKSKLLQFLQMTPLQSPENFFEVLDRFFKSWVPPYDHTFDVLNGFKSTHSKLLKTNGRLPLDVEVQGVIAELAEATGSQKISRDDAMSVLLLFPSQFIQWDDKKQSFRQMWIFIKTACEKLVQEPKDCRTERNQEIDSKIQAEIDQAENAKVQAAINREFGLGVGRMFRGQDRYPRMEDVKTLGRMTGDVRELGSAEYKAGMDMGRFHRPHKRQFKNMVAWRDEMERLKRARAGAPVGVLGAWEDDPEDQVQVERVVQNELERKEAESSGGMIAGVGGGPVMVGFKSEAGESMLTKAIEGTKELFNSGFSTIQGGLRSTFNPTPDDVMDGIFATLDEEVDWSVDPLATQAHYNSVVAADNNMPHEATIYRVIARMYYYWKQGNIPAEAKRRLFDLMSDNGYAGYQLKDALDTMSAKITAAENQKEGITFAPIPNVARLDEEKTVAPARGMPGAPPPVEELEGAPPQVPAGVSVEVPVEEPVEEQKEEGASAILTYINAIQRLWMDEKFAMNAGRDEAKRNEAKKVMQEFPDVERVPPKIEHWYVEDHLEAVMESYKTMVEGVITWLENIKEGVLDGTVDNLMLEGAYALATLMDITERVPRPLRLSIRAVVGRGVYIDVWATRLFNRISSTNVLYPALWGLTLGILKDVSMFVDPPPNAIYISNKGENREPMPMKWLWMLRAVYKKNEVFDKLLVPYLRSNAVEEALDVL